MSNVGNKFKIGVMVLLSFTLLILMLLSLGIMKYFRVKYLFMTVVETSVQGLEKGSKVKLRGVTIGQVKAIKIGNKGNEIFIYMEFDPEAFAESSSTEIDTKGEDGKTYFEQEIRENVKEGMRCKLKYGGITGNLYIDIGYYTEEQLKNANKINVDLPADHPVYIPAIPTPSLSSILEKAEKAINKISELDVDAIGKKIEEFLDTANKMAKDDNIRASLKDLRAVVANLKDFSQNIKDSVTRQRIDTIQKNLDKTFANVNKTINELSTFVSDARKEIKESDVPGTTKDARQLMVKADKSMDKILALRTDFKRSVREFNETLRSARELIDYLEKHPSSMIRGKPGEPVVKP